MSARLVGADIEQDASFVAECDAIPAAGLADDTGIWSVALCDIMCTTRGGIFFFDGADERQLVRQFAALG